MKTKLSVWVLVLVFLMTATTLVAQGQGQGQGLLDKDVLIPDSSKEHPEDVHIRAHTNHVINLRSAAKVSGPSGETPQSIRLVYNLPNGSETDGSGVIAIVDAFDYPTAQADFDKFSAQFGLPTTTPAVCNGAKPCFQTVYASGKKPKANCGWAQEAALDIEWAHAMAPYAQIVLVEADSASFADLFTAVDVATSIVRNGGTSAGQVSMSWGGSEFSGEATNDSHFTASGVTYFAASGDTGGQTIYPGTSPFVVSAGGTTINRNGSGLLVSETAWSGSGGGPSKYEPRPAYQTGIVTIVGAKRGAPDFSFDANPNTGVSVYDSTSCQGMSGWMVFGGTSVSSPSLAGIVNLAGHFNVGSTSVDELNTIYSNIGNAANFRDITSGSAGTYSAKPGWDFVTGVGSNQGVAGK